MIYSKENERVDLGGYNWRLDVRGRLESEY